MQIEQDEEGWFVASVPDLSEDCHSQARTLQGVRERIVQAIQIHMEHRGRVPRVEFIAKDRVLVTS